VLVQRGSERRSLRAAQQAGWLDGYLWAWRQDPNNPMRGQYQLVYDASELQGVIGALEPWQGVLDSGAGGMHAGAECRAQPRR
jgi:hypothetical protein